MHVKHFLLQLTTAYVSVRLLRRWLSEQSETKRRRYFADKTIVLTGASSGIGRILACQLHRLNARLILACRSVDTLRTLCSELLNENPSHYVPEVYFLDLSDPRSRQKFATQVIDSVPTIDVLIHNAGLSVHAACADTDMQVHRRLMEVNFFGPIELTQALIPKIESNGQLAVIGSIQGMIAVPLRSAYCTTKHALQAYFDCLRAELSANNNGVNVLMFNPSYVRTPLGSHSLTGNGDITGDHGAVIRSEALDPAYVVEALLDAIVERRREMVVAPRLHALIWWLRPVVPDLFFRVMTHKAKYEMNEATELNSKRLNTMAVAKL